MTDFNDGDRVQILPKFIFGGEVATVVNVFDHTTLLLQFDDGNYLRYAAHEVYKLP